MTTKAASPSDETERPRIEAGTWVYDKDLECIVPKRGRNYFGQHELRAEHLACPAIRPDGMNRAIKSMADGRVYDSKSAYYKSVRRVGAEIVGFDKNWQDHVKKPQPFGTDKQHEADIVRDVKRSIEEVESRKPAGRRPRRRSRGRATS